MELANRPQLEASFRRRLEKLTAKHRRALIKLAGDPPDLSLVPASFWQEAESDMQNQLAIALLLIFTSSAIKHEATPSSIEQRAIDFAQRWASQTASSYIRHTRDRLAQGSDLDVVLNGSRAKVIAKTETSEAQTAGGEAGKDEAGRSTEKATLRLIRVWSHTGHRPPLHSNAATEPCPTCSPLEGHSESEWRQINPSMIAPPAHPHCDCFITYYDADTGETWPKGSPEPPILRSPEIRRIKQEARG